MRLASSALAALLFAVPVAAQSYLDDVGYTALRARLGSNTPTGAGVPVAQVEAPLSTSPLVYAPDPNSFIANLAATRPTFSITYNPPLGSPPQYSGHANMVGNDFYGDNSMAQGVTTVQAWEANTWIDQVLRFGSAQVPDTTFQPRVSNHSYIGLLNSTFTAADADEMIRRADYLVDQSGHVMVAAVGGNGRSNPSEPAPIFGSIYNGITVGLSNGQHESGLTSVSGAGRVKPDIVAPMGTVSEATPVVAAAATLLVQTAGSDPLAADPRTIKAVLMAGATKDEPEFTAARPGGWAHTTTQPLDVQFGAGELNIDNSHRIRTAGRQPANPAATVAATGWDRNTAAAGATRTYFFDVPAGQRATAVSAVLTWNRTFTPGSITPLPLADLNLSFSRADAGFNLVGSPLDRSASTVDNVELIYDTTALDAGRYALVVDVNGAVGADYALAWQVTTVPIPEPAVTLLVAAAGLGGWSRLTRGSRRSGCA